MVNLLEENGRVCDSYQQLHESSEEGITNHQLVKVSVLAASSVTA